MTHGKGTARVSTLVRIAVLCALTGLLFILAFLLRGFQAWSIGLGIFVGVPLLGVAMVFYIIAVVHDLRQHKVL